MLPTPPDEREKYLYVDQNKLLIYVPGVLSLVLLSTGAYLFAEVSKWYVFYIVFYVVILLYIGVSYLIGILGKSFDLDKHESTITFLGGEYPSVDIFVPVCGEDLNIIENTLRYVKNVRWMGELNVYVLDDRGALGVAALADHYRFNYISRPNRGELKKAGNLRYAFTRTKGEYFVVFDADFCPRPDFLLETLPYFRADPKLAILQTPQFFEQKKEQSWVERGAASVQELFYRLIQVNRNTWGASICVGTCAVYRRAALEPRGGTAPIAYSEDLHTGFNCLEDGWKVKYIPINLAKGVCPDTTSSFFTQQYRWAMGSTSLLFTKRFWTAPISFMQRLSFISGMFYYVATALGLFLTPVPGILVVWFHPEVVHLNNAMFALPSFVFTTLLMVIWNKSPYGLYSIKVRLISYYAHVFALYDKLRGDIMPWVPTGSKEAKTSTRYLQFKRIMFAWVSVCTLLLISGSFYNMTSLLDYHFYPSLFFASFNYWLAMSILRDQ